MKALLTLAMLCCLFQGLAQIEVTAQDTVEVEPEEILYVVMLTHADFVSDSSMISTDTSVIFEPPVPVNDPKTKSAIDELMKLISASRIDTVPLTEFNIQWGNNYRFDKKVLLRFTSKDKLAAFVSKAKNIEGLLGNIVSLKSSQLSAREQDLIKKLLTKAKADAEFIAKQSGKQLGSVLEIREENPDEPVGGWTVYPPLSALYDYNPGQMPDKIILKRKLAVKYAWY